MLRILVFAMLLGTFHVSGNSCKYNRINKKYTDSCKKDQYLDKIFTDLDSDGEINADEILERLTSTCSNYEEYSKCARCTAKHVCIEEQDKLQEILTERWSVFCDEDQPASWLTTILQNGFYYNSTCQYSFMNIFYQCLPPSRPEYSSNETSLTGLAGVYRNLIQDAFRCSVAGILKTGNGGCGSSWQDILLANFVRFSTRFGILFYIDQEEIKQLERMRCKHEETNPMGSSL